MFNMQRVWLDNTADLGLFKSYEIISLTVETSRSGLKEMNVTQWERIEGIWLPDAAVRSLSRKLGTGFPGDEGEREWAWCRWAISAARKPDAAGGSSSVSHKNISNVDGARKMD